MKCCQLFDRLDFHDDCVFHHQVDPVAAVQMDALVSDRELNLAQRVQATAGQFLCQTDFAGRLQKTRAQFSVYLNRRSDDGLGY